MSEISVVVATYGDDEKWVELATRAVLSARRAGAEQVIYFHGDTLAQARNEGASQATGSHLVFLDADDELSPGYIGAMSQAIERTKILSSAWTWLYQPATIGIVDGIEDPEPVLIPERPLHTGNFLVIGTMVQKKLFEQVGGFQEWEAYEDWDLFWRCHNAGAGVAKVPEAVYRVHVNPNGRNNVSYKKAVELVQKIQRANR